MSRTNAACLLAGSIVLSLIAAGDPALAQIDLSGTWQAHSSTQALVAGRLNPLPVDYEGIPLNDSGRAAALLSSDLQLSEPAHICSNYPQTYLLVAGLFDVTIWNETEPRNGTTVAWHIGGWDDRSPMTIWMDGRQQPSEYAAHENAGFATGVWQDDILKVYVTHMRAGVARRNPSPLSDKTTMTAWFLRHGNQLTIVGSIVDPVYLTEPFVLTKVLGLVTSTVPPTEGEPCVQSEEGISERDVPFYLPGQNPGLNEMTKEYGIPLKAALGGAETMYPQFRKFLRTNYKRPAKCTGACGGPGTYPLRIRPQ